MKQRLLSFLSLFLLIGMNAWAATEFDLAKAIADVSSGGTVTLSADAKLSQTITINKDLTIDLKGHSITATDCRAFHIVAGDVTIKNSGKGG